MDTAKKMLSKNKANFIYTNGIKWTAVKKDEVTGKKYFVFPETEQVQDLIDEYNTHPLYKRLFANYKVVNQALRNCTE
ncbi:DUF5659 domain-containing protein [Fictibacillus enclensis]|uniref:DUF5659 domain-containing protein n=1 Tax=Fictibacillus enclensis TaxID=1017270 RepID=UPI0025A2F3B4|nr:DUF5659 domain-containing protein [Fictibacillus enclensis]MDM5199238.1 DUF5659 domain-containing protein [Fictibacillus enclensis]